MKFLDLDSPLMRFLTKMSNIMIVNVLALICCIPIITAGPALTAAHYVCLRIVRDEEGYIVKDFFKSFKQNFRQGAVIGLLLLLAALLLIWDYYIFAKSGLEFSKVIKIATIVVGIVLAMTGMYVFAVLAKFDNTIWATIRNAAIMSVLQLPKTVVMAVLYVIPIFAAAYAPQFMPVVCLFGIALPVFLSAKLYNKFFQMIEDNLQAQEEGNAQDDENGEDGEEKIFSDELDESIVVGDMGITPIAGVTPIPGRSEEAQDGAAEGPTQIDEKSEEMSEKKTEEEEK